MSWSHVTVSQGYGVMAINSIGEPYNYQCMEAIAQVQSLEFEKGIVCNVCEIVYLLEMLIKHNICCYISSILILYCNAFHLLCCILHISTVNFYRTLRALQEYQTGYKIGEKCIRPAVVAVSTGSE